MTILLLLANANRRRCRVPTTMSRQSALDISIGTTYYTDSNDFFLLTFRNRNHTRSTSSLEVLARFLSRPSDDRLGKTRCTNYINNIDLSPVVPLLIK